MAGKFIQKSEIDTKNFHSNSIVKRHLHVRVQKNMKLKAQMGIMIMDN